MAEQKTRDKMQNFVDKFRAKTGTSGYPDAKITEILVDGLAGNVEDSAGKGQRGRNEAL